MVCNTQNGASQQKLRDKSQIPGKRLLASDSGYYCWKL